MGIVYEARDKASGTRIALKTLQLLNGEALYMFKREFRALREVRHPNLIQLYDLFDVDGALFFTMELVTGVSLLEYITTWDHSSRHLRSDAVPTLRFNEALEPKTVPLGNSLPYNLNEQRLRTVLPQIVQAVHAIHTADKIHRDIKPANIMVTTEGRVVVLDFGLIVERSASRQTFGAVAGTPIYMAPEQATGVPIGSAADWYSVGITLYEALCGVLPFDGLLHSEVISMKQQFVPQSPSELRNDVPVDLDQLCMDLLSINPSNRPDGLTILRRLGFVASDEDHREDGEFFVGRTEQLAALDAAFSEVGSAGPVVAIVSGESGVGKSALVRRFQRSLRDDSAVIILHGGCHEYERVTYNAFDGVVDELSKAVGRHWRNNAATVMPRQVSLLRTTFRVLCRIPEFNNAPTPTHEPRDSTERQNGAFSALREMLNRVCDHKQVVVTIDDMQWADHDSIRLLNALVQQPDAPPIMLLLTVRDEAVAHVERAIRVPCRRIEIGCLSATNATTLARHATTRDLHEERIRTLVADAAGHPLFVIELARYANDERPRTAPKTLDDALRARVAQLRPEARRIIELACISRAPLPPTIMCSAASVSRTVFSECVRSARNEGLLRSMKRKDIDPIEPFHDRVREAVAAGLTVEATTELHVILSTSLIDTHFDREQPELLVHHLEQAGQQAVAASRAAAGAEAAMKAMAYDRAARLYEVALRLVAADSSSGSLQLRLADSLAKAGRTHEAAVTHNAVATHATGDERAARLHDAARLFLVAGDLRAGNRAAREALRLAGLRAPSTDIGTLILLLLMEFVRWVIGYPARPASKSMRTTAILSKRYHLLMSLAVSYVLIDTARARLFHLEAMKLTRKLDARAWDRVMILEAGFLGARGGSSRIQRARTLDLELDRYTSNSKDDQLLILHRAVKGTIAFYGVNYEKVRTLMPEVEELYLKSPTLEWGELNIVRIVRLIVCFYDGRLGNLRKLVTRYIQDAERRSDYFMQRMLVYRMALLWIASDELDKWHRHRARLAETAYRESSRTLLGFYEVAGAAEVALVEKTDDAQLAKLGTELDGYSTSMVAQGIHSTAFECAWLSARIAVTRYRHHGADSKALRAALAYATTLSTATPGYAPTHAELIRADVSCCNDDFEATRAHLHEARRLANKHDLLLVAHIVTLRLFEMGEHKEGAEVQKARDWLGSQGVSRIDLVKRFVTPGFELGANH